MNEKLIKELIKYKLNAANSIIDHLPAEMSMKVNNLRRVILEGVSEGLVEMKEQASKKSKPGDKLDSINIE